MKGGWQQKEGFQALSDGTTLENEMSLVSMAANETVRCIHITERAHTKMRRTDGNMEEGGKEGEWCVRLNYFGPGFHGS